MIVKKKKKNRPNLYKTIGQKDSKHKQLMARKTKRI